MGPVTAGRTSTGRPTPPYAGGRHAERSRATTARHRDRNVLAGQRVLRRIPARPSSRGTPPPPDPRGPVGRQARPPTRPRLTSRERILGLHRPLKFSMDRAAASFSTVHAIAFVPHSGTITEVQHVRTVANPGGKIGSPHTPRVAMTWLTLWERLFSVKFDGQLSGHLKDRFTGRHLGVTIRPMRKGKSRFDRRPARRHLGRFSPSPRRLFSPPRNAEWEGTFPATRSGSGVNRSARAKAPSDTAFRRAATCATTGPG